MRTLWGVIFVAACNGAPLETVGAGPPPTGVYQASETVVANNCGPGPALLTGTHVVAIRDGFVSAPIPDGPRAFVRYDLPYEGLDFEIPSCEARRHIRLEITNLDSIHLDLRRTSTWTQTLGFATLCAPAHDCTTVEEFHFTLVEACDEPCEASQFPGNATCSCVSGDGGP